MASSFLNWNWSTTKREQECWANEYKQTSAIRKGGMKIELLQIVTMKPVSQRHENVFALNRMMKRFRWQLKRASSTSHNSSALLDFSTFHFEQLDVETRWRKPLRNSESRQRIVPRHECIAPPSSVNEEGQRSATRSEFGCIIESEAKWAWIRSTLNGATAKQGIRTQAGPIDGRSPCKPEKGWWGDAKDDGDGAKQAGKDVVRLSFD